jgi:hypothetical protein
MNKTIITGALLLCTTAAMAWGQIGHRVVGKIAENHLTPKAKAEIEKILGTESLAIASTWMDDVKSDDAYDHTHAWHYTTVPNGKTYEESEKSKEGEVVQKIEDMITTLKNTTSTAEQKKEALRFLIHLVGDIHQPLHVGNGKDRGGNDYKIKWFYSNSNLHRIWDSELIEQKQFSYTELVESIDFTTSQKVKEWQSLTTAQWADESASIRETIYPDNGLEKIGYEYSYQFWGVVQDQLLKGGVRLAGVLNSIYQ